MALGVNAQTDQTIEWATVRKKCKNLAPVDALHYLDSIYQLHQQAWPTKDRIQVIETKGKLLTQVSNANTSLDFLFSDSLLIQMEQWDLSNLNQANFYIVRAKNCRNAQNYALAIEQYDLAIGHLQQTEGHESLKVYCHYFAGQSAIRMLNYDKAIAYFERVLRSPKPGKRKTNAQRYLLMALNYTDRHEEVIKQFKDINNFSEIKPTNQVRLLKEYGIALANLKQAKATQSQVSLILAIGAKGADSIHGLLEYAEYQAAEVLTANGEYAKAAALYLKNIKGDARFIQGDKDRELAKKYDRLGFAYLNDSNYEKALQAYQQALIQIFPNFNEISIDDNPPLSAVGRESFMMTSPAMKAKCLKQLYTNQPSKELLDNAATCHTLSLQAVTQLLNGYQTDEPKIFLQEYVSEFLEDAMDTSFERAISYDATDAAADALAFVSTQKAIVLRQALAKNDALITSNVPQVVQEEDKSRQSEIQQLHLELSGIDADAKQQANSVQQLLNGKITEYNVWSARLKKEYPAYAGLLQKKQSQTLDDIQGQLEGDQAVLQFYWGQKTLFSIWITADAVHLYRQPISNIESAVNEFINLVSDRKMLDNNSERYFELGYELAQQLFFTPSANEKIKDILIIPDGPLFFVPFGAFLADRHQGVYAEAPYLLKEHVFTYAYSTDLYFSNSQPSAGNGQLFGAMPFLNQAGRNLPSLPSGADELNPVNNYAQLFADQSADLATFRKQASAYSVVHLSTHASTGDQQQPPRIEFADSSLFLTQLYSSRMAADLVVLSACQTSLGDLKKGEGAMSLARGFFYAGANNLVTTLWSVNEKSTGRLIQEFYQQALTDDQSYSQALTQAQRNYLSDPTISANKKTPYYWAGLHLNGRDGQLQLKHPWSPVTIGLFALAILATLGWFFRKKTA